MHKCIVCGNLSTRTRRNRPGVIYHGFPKNEYIRRRWLKVLGINRCYDWQRICSDHFLEENYKPGIKRFLYSNTLPQPYHRNRHRNAYVSNYAARRKNVAPVSNEVLPMEQNIMSDEHIANAVVNNDNNESPSLSCGQDEFATNDEDSMSYEDMSSLQTDQFGSQSPTLIASDNTQTVIETDVVPALKTSMDHTLGYGLRCSVKSCFNRHSKDLSLFGYPKDFTLRKKWIEKCGLEKDITDRVLSGVRVCSAHFEDNCFKNSELRNRLRPGSVPTLFLDEGIIDTRNIPPTSSSPNNSFIRTNKPSCSSSNYVSNIESNQTPLMVYMDSTTRNAKDFEAYCSIPGCITNTNKEVDDISLFAPTTECISEWSSILGLSLTVNSIVCERHFRPQDILNPELLVNGVNEKVKSLAPHALPIPVEKLRTYDDQFIGPKDNKVDEPSTEEIKNNVLDNTDQCSTNTSISSDDSTCSSPLPSTLEPIESSEVVESSVNLPISPTSKSSSTELIETEAPVITRSISLSGESDTEDSYSDSSTKTLNSMIMGVSNTEHVEKKENGFIFEISKQIILPNLLWKSEHLDTQNATGFYQRDFTDETVKKIHFYNSLVPTIQIYGKKYEYNEEISTKIKLENLLEKLDSIEKCYGYDGCVSSSCIGYLENNSKDIYMCSACQGLVTDQALERMKKKLENKANKIARLEENIAKRKKRIKELRKGVSEIIRVRKLKIEFRSCGFSDIITKPRFY